MITCNRLTSVDKDSYFKKIALMNVTVFEDLYYFAEEDTPYECSADCIIGPKDKYHNEYFRACKKVAVEIADIWDYKLRLFNLSETDKIVLDKINNAIKEANNSVELIWAGIQLLQNVSPHIDNGKFIPPDLVA